MTERKVVARSALAPAGAVPFGVWARRQVATACRTRSPVTENAMRSFSDIGRVSG